MQTFRLDGRRAVVTGGASGIGYAIARELAEAGAEVVVVDLSEDGARAAAEAIGAETKGRLSGLGCDVADEADVEKVFAEIADPGGRIDILVNSAGVAHVGTVLETSAEDFERLFRVNVRGTFLCMRAAAKRMVEQRSGVVLNLASIAASAGIEERFAYSMTKGAVVAMTLSGAKDLLPFGVRCNCISPARVHTAFVDGFVRDKYSGREEEMMKTLSAAQPVGRMGRPEEIALLALYLCSDAASFVTGSDMPIDGGYLRLR